MLALRTSLLLLLLARAHGLWGKPVSRPPRSPAAQTSRGRRRHPRADRGDPDPRAARSGLGPPRRRGPRTRQRHRRGAAVHRGQRREGGPAPVPHRGGPLRGQPRGRAGEPRAGRGDAGARAQHRPARRDAARQQHGQPRGRREFGVRAAGRGGRRGRRSGRGEDREDQPRLHPRDRPGRRPHRPLGGHRGRLRAAVGQRR
jgi:hypothetical protein